jgi:hypothetical protein
MRRLLMALLLLFPPMIFADGATNGLSGETPPPNKRSATPIAPFWPEKGRIVKMLPLLLDLKGHDALSPSLFDRDAYQARLRRRPALVSGIRFDLLWQVKNPSATNYTLRLELRGIGEDSKPTIKTLELEASPSWLRRWNSMLLNGDDYKKFGELVAWRATLWHGDRLLSEEKSFLW